MKDFEEQHFNKMKRNKLLRRIRRIYHLLFIVFFLFSLYMWVDICLTAKRVSQLESEASYEAGRAETYAEESERYASKAAGFVDDASSSASSASSYASTAEEYSNKARRYADDASSSASSAEEYASKAERHADDAEGTAQKAEESAEGCTTTWITTKSLPTGISCIPSKTRARLCRALVPLLEWGNWNRKASLGSSPFTWPQEQ